VALCVVEKLPEIVTLVCAATEAVVTVKSELVEPAGTVTLAGTAATAGLLLESVTVAPPGGAAELKVSVPVTLLLAATLVGFSVKDDRFAFVTVIIRVGGLTFVRPELSVTVKETE
jgi:hypothetical protein